MSEQTAGVDSIFCAAVEIEATAERAAYVEQACADDPELKGRVQKLLDAHFRAGAFLESPPAGLDATGMLPEISERPGTIIGRYKLMERIGEGGMGVVYAAEQREPVRRKVALKIIKPGMDTKEVIARFEAERQALALMDHPNIARVFDAGATESGRPYFVMELVRGIPITDYCDQNNLTARERLELFVSVCQAVQHAHQKAVIHRDVKPTNILVTLHDGRPVPKIIDFGVAKAINQQLTERTVYTRHMQMIGTPLYMSPEQAELSGLDVDTRTDIYSLGVLLYELLTGTTPFDKERLHQAAYDEVRRIIREEEPPKPSTRISTLGATATAISAHRKTDPKRLSQLIRGDLDWIVMKALEKDRTRRYETATGFARDVERYLRDEPVEARAPSTLYRLRKFVRRNKVPVTTSAVVAAVLILAVVVTVREKSKGAVNRLNIELIGCIQRRQLPEAENILEKLVDGGHGGNRATLSAQRQLAEAYAEPEVDRLEDAVALLQRTQEMQRLVLGEQHAETCQTAKTLRDLADTCETRARELSVPAGAPQAEYDRARELARLAVECHASSGGFRWFTLAMTQYRCEQWEASLNSLRKSLEADFPWPREWLLLAMIHWQLGDQARARDWCAAGHEWITNNPDSDSAEYRLSAEATSLLRVGPQYPPADWTSTHYLELYSRLIQSHPRVGMLFYRRGSHQARLGNWKEAAEDYAKGTELPSNWRAWEARVAVCLQMGDAQGYETVCREMLAKFGNQGSHFVFRMDSVVLCCLRPSKDANPAELYRIASDALSEDPDNTFLQLGKGMAAYRCGRYQEAIEVIPERGFSCPPKDQVLALLVRAMAFKHLGDAARARTLLERADQQIRDQVPGPAGPPVDAAQDRPVVWCMVQAALREAEELIEPAGQRSDSVGDGVKKEHPEAPASSTP